MNTNSISFTRANTINDKPNKNNVNNNNVTSIFDYMPKTKIIESEEIESDNDLIEELTNKNKSNHPSAYTSRGIIKAKTVEPFSSEDITKMKKHFLDKKEYRNYMLFLLGVSLGFRIGDLLSLRISDVMNTNSTFKKRVEIYEQKTKKFNNPLLIKTSQQAIALYFENIKSKNKDYEIKNHMDDYLFMSAKGFKEVLKVPSAHKILKTTARELNIDRNIGTHSLRKTHFHIMYDNETNKGNNDALDLVQIGCNHSDKRTSSRYIGLTQERIDEAKQGISDILEKL
jgi:integrase